MHAQYSSSIDLKYGIVITNNSYKKSKEFNLDTKTGTLIGLSYTKTKNKFLYGGFFEFEGAKQEHSISNINFHPDVPPDFKMYWISSFGNYQFGVNLGYKFYSRNGFNIWGIISPQLSIYSHDQLTSGYENFYAPTNPYYITYDDPQKYENIYQSIYTCNPKAQIEVNKSFGRANISAGISYMYYWKYLKPIENYLLIATQDNKLYQEYFTYSYRPQTYSPYLKIGYRFK